MNTINKQSDRDKALVWWATMSNANKAITMSEHYYSGFEYESLGPNEIEALWRKETQPTTGRNADIQKASHWWEVELDGSQRGKLLDEWYGAKNVTIDAEDILLMWLKKTAIPKTNTKESSTGHEATNGELQCTPGEWEVRGNKIFIEKTYRSICTVHVQKNFEERTFKPIEDVEAEANAHLIAASKDMYNQLLESKKEIEYLLSEVKKLAPGSYRAQGTISRIESVLKKANKNFKP